MPSRARVLEALRWTTGTRIAGYLLTWTINLLVIRLLAPADYGRMALCMAWIGLAEVFAAFGQRAVLVQREALDDGLLRRIHGGLLLWNAFLFVLLQATAPLFAAFFGDHTLTAMIRVMAFAVLLSSLVTVPLALRWREIDFAAVSVMAMLQAVSASLIVLLFALRGFGVWALVAGQLGGVGVHTIGILWATGFRLWPDFRVTGLGAELRFGGRVVSRVLVGYVNQQVETVLIGKLLGSASLGVFSVAGSVARQPIRALLAPAGRVSQSTFARIQNEPARIRAYYLGSVEAIGLVFFPMLWGIGVVAEDLVKVVMGERWTPAIPIIWIFCLLLPFTSGMRLVPMILEGLGHPEVSLRNAVTSACCLPVGIALGVQFGLTGVAWGWLAAQAVSTAINLRRTLPVMGARFGAVAAVVWPSLVAAALMAVAVLAAKASLLGALDPPWRLASSVALGGVSYGLATLVLNRTALQRALRLIRG